MLYELYPLFASLSVSAFCWAESAGQWLEWEKPWVGIPNSIDEFVDRNTFILFTPPKIKQNKIKEALSLMVPPSLFHQRGLALVSQVLSSSSFSSFSFLFSYRHLNWIGFSPVTDLSQFTLDMNPSTFWFYIVMIINLYVLKICLIKSCSFVFGLILFWTRNTLWFSC